MFSSCHSLSDAKQIFIDLPVDLHTVYLWNAIISAFVNHGQHKCAIGLYHDMSKYGLHIDKHICIATMKACFCKSSIDSGRQIHSDIIKLGFEIDLLVCNTLITMYIKSGNFDDGRLIFMSIPEKDLVTWNALISGFADHGWALDTFFLFAEMYKKGYEPTLVTYLSIIKACARVLAFHDGRFIHALIVENCLEQERFMGNSLIDFYAKCESLEDALKVFDTLQTHDVATSNTMINAFAQHGHVSSAFDLFQKMLKKGFKPDDVTFISILKACSSIQDIECVKMIDNQIRCYNSEYDTYVASTLIDIYTKCGSIENAIRVFNSSRIQDIVTWNTIIGGLAQHDHFHAALQLFKKMQVRGIRPDTVTYISLLKSSSNMESLKFGKLIHTCIIDAGLENESLIFENSIIDMYTKFSSMEDAQDLFERLTTKDVVSWNTIISGYVQSERSFKCYQIFQSMQEEGVYPDKVTFSVILKACSGEFAHDCRKLIHSQIIENGIESDTLIESALIESYARVNNMEDARRVFSRASKQSVHAWNTLIAGYIHCEQIKDGLGIFEDMQRDMIQPNETTLITVLQGCSRFEAFDATMLVNDLIMKKKLDHDVFVMSTLVDAYAKHGKLKEAVSIFLNIAKPSVVTWSGLISGHVQHGDGLGALCLFYQMESSGVEPNEATYACAVRACILIDSLEQGKLVHDCSIRKGLVTNEVVGSALVNLYATSGSMEDASNVFSKLSNQDAITWNAIISGLTHLNDPKMALQYFEQMQILGLQPDFINFASLLAGCGHVGLINEGFDIFGSIDKVDSTLHNTGHFNCLIDLLGRAGYLSKAKDALEAIPPVYSVLGWRSLLGHCQTHSDTQLGRRCFERLVELGYADASIYKIMSNIYSWTGMEENAKTVESLRSIIEMEERNHDLVCI
ncbi:hypothetical protein KP509_23G021700 [Ceratopteris richardii]|nr:hypothetical protein KP509_23G021700 [Ceratopteris richardii]